MTNKLKFKKGDVRNEPSFKRCTDNPEAYKLSLKFQEDMAKIGVAWHNNFSNECTIDFCCCLGGGDYKMHVPQSKDAHKI